MTDAPMPNDRDRLRAAFEEWVTRPPFGKSIDRNPNDPATFAWPGQYVDYSIQLAWEAFRAGAAHTLTNGERTTR